MVSFDYIISLIVICARKLFPAESHWRNQHGSQLSLYSDNSGNLTGTFATAVGGGIGVPRAITGTYNQFGISFTANHQEQGSISTWAGLINEQQTEITALWLLVRGEEIVWDSTNVGQDVFYRVGKSAMIAALYRTILKDGEQLALDYEQSWKTIAEYFVKHKGALGSRIHQASDNKNLWIVYSCWPDAATIQKPGRLMKPLMSLGKSESGF